MPLVGVAYLFLFLPAAALVCAWTARRPSWRTAGLLLTGILFYAISGGITPLVLLLGLTGLTFVAIRLMARPQPAARHLGLALLLVNLASLFGFKLTALLQPAAGMVLPLGLSFYVFNLVSHGLDVYRSGTAPASSLPRLAAYSTFFPTIGAGPLLRYGDFQSQESARSGFDMELAEWGILHLVVGLAKKVLVADPVGAAVAPWLDGYEHLGLDAWLAMLGYAYQLYFDFSGYSDMAIGSAALLGFRLPRNFDAPYTAIHITEFWQRWHITMSQWFRDYLFLPLSRAALRRSGPETSADSVRAACLILTMVVIGLWHGLQWNYLVWGLYHGVLLAAHARIRTARGRRIPPALSSGLTFGAVLIGWVLLRSPSPDVAVRIIGAMAGLHGFGSWGARHATVGAAIAFLLVLTSLTLEDALLVPRRTSRSSWMLAALLAASLLGMAVRQSFLYFQF